LIKSIRVSKEALIESDLNFPKALIQRHGDAVLGIQDGQYPVCFDIHQFDTH